MIERAEKLSCELPGLGRVELFDGKLARVSGFGGLVLEKPLNERARLGFLAAIGGDQEHRRSLWRVHELVEQGGTVDVAPLQVVDKEDNVALFGESRQKLTEGRECAAPQLEGVGDLDCLATGCRHGLDPSQNRKDPGER